MFKSILSVLGGTALGVFTIGVIQYLGSQVYPLPAGLTSNDSVAMASYLEQAPAGMLLLVLLAYAFGSFFGGMLGARYAPGKPIGHALAVGIILLLFGITNLWMMPHPIWFVVAAVVVFVPMAFFGGMMSSRRIP
ncbi:hypothetical protein [Rufibacter sp. LB8]|uniref:hypothetical protein n=1 Tax=Rufibacter sp. LB8 TaxID=2777781 RepID=UPI00178C3FE4|nr:hypothetical protein [Rufibacter sp. LB8]